MSIEAIAKASKTTGLPSTTKFVLIALSNYANDDGAAWPKHQSIADWCSMSRETVQRHLATLEKYGYISSEKRHYDDGRYASKMYRLLFLADNFQPCDSQPCDGESQHHVTERHTVRVTEDHNKNHHLDPLTVEGGVTSTDSSRREPIHEPAPPPSTEFELENEIASFENEIAALGNSAEARAEAVMQGRANPAYLEAEARAFLRGLGVDVAHPQLKPNILAWYQLHGKDILAQFWRAAWKQREKRPIWYFVDACRGSTDEGVLSAGEQEKLSRAKTRERLERLHAEDQALLERAMRGEYPQDRLGTSHVN